MKHIFIAPPFDEKSGGVKSFYKLFNYLFNLNEFDLDIICKNQNFSELFAFFPNIHSFYSNKLKSFRKYSSDIYSNKKNLIFTETFVGLPIKSEYGTLWKGNVFAGLPTTQLGSFFPEKVMTFHNSSCISNGSNRLYIDNIDFDSFNPKKTKNKNFFLVYVGKKFFSESSINKGLREITEPLKDNFVLIDRGWPAREITKSLIQNCSGLISFDPLTSLVYETLSCNKPVLLKIDESDYWTESLIRRFDLPQDGLFINDMNNFMVAAKKKLNLHSKIVYESVLLEQYDLNKFVDYLRLLSLEDFGIVDKMKSYRSLLDFKSFAISESVSNRLSE